MSSSTGGSNSNMVRNIVTGVITTVVGTTAVYFLGFHNKGGNSQADFLVQKEATIQGWKSFITAENIFTTNWNDINAEYKKEKIRRYRENITQELNELNNKIQKIHASDDLDPTFSGLLEKKLITNTQWGQKFEKYMDGYENILNQNLSENEQNEKLNKAVNEFSDEVGGINRRFMNEIDNACKALTEKYSYNFARTDLLMYQTTNNNNNSGNNNGGTGGNAGIDWKMLVGKWQTNANGAYVGTLYQYEDGRMYYYFFNGDSTYGRWQYNNNQLILFYDKYFGAGYNFRYTISDFSTNGYKMTFVDSPYNVFNVVKAN